MKSSTRINRVDQRGRTKDLLDAVEGMPSHHQAAMVARILKDVLAGTISAAEANELRKAVKI